MRVLFVSNRFPPDFVGGYEISAWNVATQLLKRGHEVHVLTKKAVFLNDKDPRIYRVLNFERTSYRRRYSPIHQRLKDIAFGTFFNLNNFLVAHRFIRNLKPDIIDIWNLNGISLSPLIAALRFRLPLVIHTNDHTFAAHAGRCLCLPVIRKHIPNVIFYSLLKRASFRIIAISNYIRNILIERGFSGTNVAVINSGVDISMFRPMNIGSGPRFTILYVGRLHPDKGIHILLRAFASCVKNHKDAELTIVGAGSSDYQWTLSCLASSLNISRAVRFLGKINHEELYEIYNSADVFVYPSTWSEPFGRAILEAMACGVPVIASNVGGISEIIVNGKNGVLVNPNDVHALASALMEIRGRANLAASIAKDGLRTINEKFLWNKIVDQLLQEYESLVEQKASHSEGSTY